MRIYVWIVILYDVFEHWDFCEDGIVVVVVLFCRVVILYDVFERWDFCEDIVHVVVVNVVVWKILGVFIFAIIWEATKGDVVLYELFDLFC